MSRCCAPRSARGARSRCTSRAIRPARCRPSASSSAPTGSARSTTRTCSASTTRARSRAARSPSPRRRRAAGWTTLLADGPLSPAPAIRIARQVASAVDALEEAGAPPPPLIAERIWVDPRGDAHLDGLDAHLGVALARRLLLGLARRLLERHDPARPGRASSTVLTRAVEGAYLSAGQFAEELRRVETGSARRRRDTALTITACATLMLVIVLLVTLA